MKTYFLEVPELSSLYDFASAGFLNQIKEALWFANQYDLIVFYQGSTRLDSGPIASDYGMFLREPFTDFVKDWRETLLKIRACETLVIYHSDGDVLGSWFELCVAAKKRIFSQRASRAGFPQLREGFIPLFDSIASEWQDFEIRGFEFWESAPVRSWREFYVMKNWHYSAVPWRTLYFELDSKETLIRVLDTSEVNRQSGDTFRELDAIELNLVQAILKARWFQRFWQAYKDAVRNGNDSLNVVMDGFYKWAARTKYYSVPETPQRVTDQYLLFRIAQYHPPLRVVYRALMQGWKVVFLYSDLEKGETYLNILRKELIKLLGSFLGTRVWDRNIRWFSYDPTVPILIGSLEFYRGGEVFLNGLNLVGRRSNGNRFYTQLGVIEIDDQFKGMVSGLSTLGERVVRTKARARLGQWASIYVQKIFCQLLQYYEAMGLNLADAEEALRARGWGSMTMARFRNLFLETYPPTPDEQARFKLSSAPRNAPLFMRNLKLLSLHLKIVAGYLAKKLYEEGIVDSLEDADILVCLSLELPSNIKSAVGLFSNFGLKRVAEDFAALPEFLWHNPMADEEKNVF